MLVRTKARPAGCSGLVLTHVSIRARDAQLRGHLIRRPVHGRLTSAASTGRIKPSVDAILNDRQEEMWMYLVRSRLWLILATLFLGCSGSGSRVVLYCAQDQEFADEVLKTFQQRT